MSACSAFIFDIHRGSMHDGPGMRTVLFLKGCSLRCDWCQNPEGIGREPVLSWNAALCAGCGQCVSRCARRALVFKEDGLSADLALCARCGCCVNGCPTGALSQAGKERAVEELFTLATRDRTYYTAFGGGVTVSGGEPLMQADAVAELFRRLRLVGVNTALDTCGAVPWASFEKVLPETDCVLYDVKIIDAKKHAEHTGADNAQILENLRLLSRRVTRLGTPELWIRTPVIPGATDDEENIGAIAEFLSPLPVSRWELCAFNPMAKAKYDRLRLPWRYAGQGAISREEARRLEEVAFGRGFEKGKLIVSGILR